MAGASTRLLFLLTNPSSLIHQRPISLFRLARHHSITFPFTTLTAAPNHHHLCHTGQYSPTPTKFPASVYSTRTNYAFQDNHHVSADGYRAPPSHPWQEWSRLLESLSIAGYFNGNGNIEDEFVESEKLSKEFVAAVNSCLAFARDRPEILGWLPRKDMEVIINDGYPFLFKSGHEIERRMRAFLQGSNEATSVDLMKYILSYASNPGRNINEAAESSVRRLLHEIGNLANRGRTSEQYEQKPRNPGPNITMKRGDWICQKCSFMNFARNTKCLECEELRPQRQTIDGEWDCPRCNFFNYRKNVVCLKCECKRPDTAPSHGSNPGYVPSMHTQGTEKEVKTERWFKKVKELHGVTGPENDIIRKEENRFLDNKGKNQSFPPHQGSTSGFVPFPPDHFAKKDSTIKPTNEVSYWNTNRAPFDQNLVQETSNQFRTNEPKRETSYVGQQTPESMNGKGQNLVQETSNQFRTNEPKHETSYVGQQTPESMNGKGGWTGKSLEGSAVTEPDPLDMSEEAKAERWFKRVAQIKDISELSQIPDEDFPSIMPMRKGVNRFVVSKRKTPLERRLTSPQYRKNLRIMSSDPMKKEDD
ncbi:putative Zinc finger, RanBP2-type [Helianthus anomalus]